MTRAIARPRLDRSLVRRTVAGLRPFRPAGFRVEMEQVGDATIIHDYGHGGSGLTLAYGTAELAVLHALETPHRTATVIGAGAAGLTAARLLQDAGFGVRVYGELHSPSTTSDVAGALWGVFSVVDADHDTPHHRARIEEVARASYRHLASLDPDAYGIRSVPLYLVGGDGALPWELGLTPEMFPVTPVEAGHHPFRAEHVLRTQGMLIDPAKFLAALREDVVRRGGLVITRHFHSVEEILELGAPLVINCSGLGARTLVGDDTLLPIKGELALLDPQPEVDYAVVSLDDDAYILPRPHALVVGGSALRGDESLEVGEAALTAILERARRLYRPET